MKPKFLVWIGHKLDDNPAAVDKFEASTKKSEKLSERY